MDGQTDWQTDELDIYLDELTDTLVKAYLYTIPDIIYQLGVAFY